jgi:dTDP-4-dehydrorhamnose reductase
MTKRILVIGANGMLGGSVFRFLSKKPEYEVLGTTRSQAACKALLKQGFPNVMSGIDACNLKGISDLIHEFNPDFLVNCIGVVKQLDISKSPIPTISLNSLLPHQLSELCDSIGCSLIHFSTDCVFSGQKGCYSERDTPDANDLYGRSKLLGEVNSAPHLTLRTSIVGHEINGHVSLVDWYLEQDESIQGFSNAIFSGLPTVYVAHFLHLYVLGSDLSGLYHLSAEPIDKFTLLTLIKNKYEAKADIRECGQLRVDKSLISDKLKSATGVKVPNWPELISLMFDEYEEYFLGR